METTLYLIFSFCLILSSLGVAFGLSTIHSAFYLILSFFNGSCFLLLLGSDFLGFLFILIYVGAVSVLFLFVIIILNLNLNIRTKFTSSWSGFWFRLFSFFCVCFFSYLSHLWFSTRSIGLFNVVSPYSFEWISSLDFLSSLNLFSQILYTYFFSFLLLAGFVLLVAIVGSVFLTIKRSSVSRSKTYSIVSQLSRDSLVAIYLLKLVFMVG